ncbi:MAG: calcium-binding protein, partial [Pseudomonadota bacterium]
EYSPTKGSDEPVETGIGFLAFNPSTGSNPGVFDNVINMFGFGSLTGGAGNNFATGDGAAQTIILGPGDDTTFGGAGDDSVGSTTGDDVIYGNQGNDTVFGGQDDDRLFGGADQDAVYGNQGADTLFGNIGTDTGFGGQGDDVIYGNQGDDQLSGNRGNDLLFGGQGNDVLQGQGGDDVLFGGQGGDRFTFVSDPQGADLGRDVIRDYNAAAGDVIAGSVFSASSTTTLEDGSLRLSAEDGSSVLVIGITDISQLVFG